MFSPSATASRRNMSSRITRRGRRKGTTTIAASSGWERMYASRRGATSSFTPNSIVKAAQMA